MLSLDIRLSKAQVMAIADHLHHDEGGIEAMLIQMKQTDHPRVAYNAAWVLSHLSKEDKRIYLLPHYGELVALATSTALCFRRGLLLAVLADFPTDEVNGKLLDFCLLHLTDPKESDSARSAMIKLTARMCKPYPELCKELMLHLDMMPQDSSPSIAAAKRNALKRIQKKMNKTIYTEYGTVELVQKI